MKPSWHDKSQMIHRRFMDGVVEPYSNEMVRFLSLAICGEAGELANFIKKSWRGDAIDNKAVASELADIRIYLQLMATSLGIDLDECCIEKLKEVDVRLLAKGK